MRPDLDRASAPSDLQIGVVILFLGDGPDTVGEIQCHNEVAEREVSLQVLGSVKPPALVELAKKLLSLLTRHRRNAATAGNTLFVR